MRKFKTQKKELTTAEREEALWENVHGLAASLELKPGDIGELLKAPKSTFQRWRSNGRIPDNDPLRLEIIANFLRLGFNLEAMFTSTEDRRRWLRHPHAAFNLQTPLDLAKKSFENLIRVRSYLDYVRGLGA